MPRDQIAEQAQLRALIRVGTGFVEGCYDYHGGGVSAHLGRQLSQLLALAAGNNATVRKWSNVVSDVEARARVLIEEKREPEGATISWPWRRLNIDFKEMRRGELVIVAARPSVGKSSLMRPIVATTARNGFNVLVESLEVSPDDIAIQLAASAAKVTWSGLPHAHHADQADFLRTLHGLALPNLHVFDADRTLAAVAARAKAIHANQPIDMIAIDYLGLMSDCEPGRGETKAQAVGRVTKGFKRLAMELNCVVVLLAQLNRGPVQQGNREPVLSDLRDSGDIEQDADRVVFIHRPEEDTLTGVPQRDSDNITDTPRFYQPLIQAKGRSVGTGISAFYFNRATTTFEPCVPERVEPAAREVLNLAG